MYRRLYYLLPDLSHAVAVAKDLVSIPGKRKHAVVNSGMAKTGSVKKSEVTALADVSEVGAEDSSKCLEWYLWRGKLLLFFLALGAGIGLFLEQRYTGTAPTFMVALWIGKCTNNTLKRSKVH